MVSHGVGRIARRTDGKYFLYLPKYVVEDSAFPFSVSEASVSVDVRFDEKRLIVTACKMKERK